MHHPFHIDGSLSTGVSERRHLHTDIVQDPNFSSFPSDSIFDSEAPVLHQTPRCVMSTRRGKGGAGSSEQKGGDSFPFASTQNNLGFSRSSSEAPVEKSPRKSCAERNTGIQEQFKDAQYKSSKICHESPAYCIRGTLIKAEVPMSTTILKCTIRIV